jgi:hypothetical protein
MRSVKGDPCEVNLWVSMAESVTKSGGDEAMQALNIASICNYFSL